jgi:uncharacterized membrane protein YeiH
MIVLPDGVELFAVTMFAMSGALAATDRQMHKDFFGVAFTGFITAIGGGSLRDIILGARPLVWINDIHYMYAIVGGVSLSVIFQKWLIKIRRTLFIFDTIGIGVYTIIGLQKALAFGVNPLAAVILGMFSAVFGGVIRDTLINEIPLIFRKEIYATACLAGALLYVGLDFFHVNSTFNGILSVCVIIAIRVIAVMKKWSLPTIK